MVAPVLTPPKSSRYEPTTRRSPCALSDISEPNSDNPLPVVTPEPEEFHTSTDLL